MWRKYTHSSAMSAICSLRCPSLSNSHLLKFQGTVLQTVNCRACICIWGQESGLSCDMAPKKCNAVSRCNLYKSKPFTIVPQPCCEVIYTVIGSCDMAPKKCNVVIQSILYKIYVRWCTLYYTLIFVLCSSVKCSSSLLHCIPVLSEALHNNLYCKTALLVTIG